MILRPDVCGIRFVEAAVRIEKISRTVHLAARIQPYHSCVNWSFSQNLISFRYKKYTYVLCLHPIIFFICWTTSCIIVLSLLIFIITCKCIALWGYFIFSQFHIFIISFWTKCLSSGNVTSFDVVKITLSLKYRWHWNCLLLTSSFNMNYKCRVKNIFIKVI